MKSIQPYLFKDYRILANEHYEYRQFSLFVREWGAITIHESGVVTWKYVFYHRIPLFPFYVIEGVGADFPDKVPQWFQQKVWYHSHTRKNK